MINDIMSDKSSEMLNESFEKNESFISCEKCPQFQLNIKDWISHLVEFHPIPKIWMSASTDLIDRRLIAPYTVVTDSRKTRRKNITPRPLNSFMIFSRHLRRVVLLFFASESNSEISKSLGKAWTKLSPDIKNMYNLEAKRLAILHSEEFPDYKYKPQKRKKLNKVKMNAQDLNVHKESDSVIKYLTRQVRNSSMSYKLPSYTSSNDSFGNIIKHKNDEFNDTESRSFYRLQKKIEQFNSISSLSNQSVGYFSEKNCSPYEFEHLIDDFDINSNNFIVKKDKGLHNYDDIIRSKEVLQVPLTKPFIIVPEKMDAKPFYPIMHSIKEETIFRFEESLRSHTISQNNVKHLAKKRDYELHNNVKTKCNRNVIVQVGCQSETNYLMTKNPLINESVCDSENFVDDCFDLGIEYNNQCASWLSASPNYKMSDISSNSSHNNDEDNYKSLSPLLLSEPNYNIVEIQRLPAIGSWLRSNNSEYMI